MRFACLGSGSRGNATLVQAGSTTVLVDCGFSTLEIERRLARVGCSADAIAAILVTHEHSDHVAGVERLARKYGIAVWATPGTAQQRLQGVSHLQPFSCHEPFAIGDLTIQPFPVPHDAQEPCQFVFGDGARRVALLTDTGSITPHIEATLNGVDALMLECNHDAQMLACSRYSQALKRRVGGAFGHLSNDQSAEFLARMDLTGLQHLVAMHLSEQNNTVEQVRTTLDAMLGCGPDWPAVADQEGGLDWRVLR